jgi:hypothetical protein
MKKVKIKSDAELQPTDSSEASNGVSSRLLANATKTVNERVVDFIIERQISTIESTSQKSDEDELERVRFAQSYARRRADSFAFQLGEIKANSDSSVKKPRVILNVGGVRFETYLATFESFSGSFLATLNKKCCEYDATVDEYFFDRDPVSFQAIINFFRTGKLHVPSGVCANQFHNELCFWGLDDFMIQPCCYTAYCFNRECDHKLRKINNSADCEFRLNIF